MNDEAEVEKELDKESLHGIERETRRQMKLDSRRTDRELRGLKDKIRQLQVQLRIQHIKNFQTCNKEVIQLQNELQTLFLKHCSSVRFQDMSGEPDSEKQNVATSPQESLMKLLADLIDASMLEIRSVDVGTNDEMEGVFGRVMKYLDWMLLKGLPQSSNANAGNTTGSANALALPPDMRTKALMLGALLNPKALASIGFELKRKLQRLDLPQEDCIKFLVAFQAGIDAVAK